jgi:hypothetical protein
MAPLYRIWRYQSVAGCRFPLYVRFISLAYLLPLVFHWCFSSVSRRLRDFDDFQRAKSNRQLCQPLDGASRHIWCHQSIARYQFSNNTPMTILCYRSRFMRFSRLSVREKIPEPVSVTWMCCRTNLISQSNRRTTVFHKCSIHVVFPSRNGLKLYKRFMVVSYWRTCEFSI